MDQVGSVRYGTVPGLSVTQEQGVLLDLCLLPSRTGFFYGYMLELRLVTALRLWVVLQVFRCLCGSLGI